MMSLEILIYYISFFVPSMPARQFQDVLHMCIFNQSSQIERTENASYVQNTNQSYGSLSLLLWLLLSFLSTKMFPFFAFTSNLVTEFRQVAGPWLPKCHAASVGSPTHWPPDIELGWFVWETCFEFLLMFKTSLGWWFLTSLRLCMNIWDEHLVLNHPRATVLDRFGMCGGPTGYLKHLEMHGLHQRSTPKWQFSWTKSAQFHPTSR